MAVGAAGHTKLYAAYRSSNVGQVARNRKKTYFVGKDFSRIDSVFSDRIISFATYLPDYRIYASYNKQMFQRQFSSGSHDPKIYKKDYIQNASWLTSILTNQEGGVSEKTLRDYFIWLMKMNLDTQIKMIEVRDTAFPDGAPSLFLITKIDTLDNEMQKGKFFSFPLDKNHIHYKELSFYLDAYPDMQSILNSINRYAGTSAVEINLKFY